MANNTNHDWVLPAAIPFADLKGKDLEECVYWLLDAMGAKDLEWRIGGSGGGAADGGRDLEAHFFEPDGEGEIRQQRWWIECKGRTGTVESHEVKAAVNNALAYDGLDRLIIATNTQYSNPTLDWVKEWQKKHPSPKVQLWDQAHLERYLSRHPDVVLRLFSEALSMRGRAQAMESRFWNKLEFVSPRTLVDIWNERERVELTGMGIFALVVNEFANGDITHRPWGAVLHPETAVEVLGIGLTNIGYLFIRSSRTGMDQRILIRTFAYLILVVLELLPGDVTARLVIGYVNRRESDPFPDEVLEVLLGPILNQVAAEMQDLCSSNCKRVMLSDRKALSDGRNELEAYWLRFDPDGLNEETDGRFIRIEKGDEPCVVGFAVDKDNHCPLFAVEPTVKNITDLMDIVKRVAAFRKAKAAAQRAEDQQRVEAVQKTLKAQ
ncbi:restriction endonuclease [Paraburkholderia dioscoreae]|uniref:Restriction endonuclease family protein n=1 Tax=Paraburkholderia dioscoreae TaxID=2604047 RepID=A0A5Q4YUU4_9BURK|nr:restriction endonuclease [Paraburkholderia dioscoreae]VVD30885.1 Restriction endonuclease family protein [Paraburkholderia dioscoreae]